MLRIKILELEKLQKKYNKLSKRIDSLMKENDSLRIAFDSSQQDNLKMKNLIQEYEKKNNNIVKVTKGKKKRNDPSRKSKFT